MLEKSRLRWRFGMVLAVALSVLCAACSKPSSIKAGGCECTANLYNCKDFSTQGAAQACFETCSRLGAGDVHWLDADNDGVACEWNRRSE